MSIFENVGNKQLAVHCLVIALAGKGSACGSL